MLISHTFSQFSTPKRVMQPSKTWKCTLFVENCLFCTPKRAHAACPHLFISKNNPFTAFSWSRLLTTMYLSGPPVLIITKEAKYCEAFLWSDLIYPLCALWHIRLPCSSSTVFCYKHVPLFFHSPSFLFFPPTSFSLSKQGKPNHVSIQM